MNNSFKINETYKTNDTKNKSPSDLQGNLYAEYKTLPKRAERSCRTIQSTCECDNEFVSGELHKLQYQPEEKLQIKKGSHRTLQFLHSEKFTRFKIYRG